MFILLLMASRQRLFLPRAVLHFIFFFLSVFLVQQHNVLISTFRQEHSAGLNVSKLKEMVSGVAFCLFDDVV